MSGSHYGLLLIGMVVLITGVAAAETSIDLRTDSDWLVADGDSCSIVVMNVTDTTGAPLVGVPLALSCDRSMGTVRPSMVMTGPDGVAWTAFIAGTQSGTATITATAHSINESGTSCTISTSCEQQIDHDTPHRLTFREYDGEVTVGTTTTIVLGMEDRYGNPVDSRRTAEKVRFLVGSPEGRAGIWDGAAYVDDILLPVDGKGHVTAEFRADPKAGENIIYVALPKRIHDTYLIISGLGAAVPASIACSVSPTGTPDPWVPADGKSTFTLTYTLKDAYGNPAGNRSLLLTTSLGESLVDPPPRSNSDGQVVITYGPKDTTGKVTITAASKDDPSVTCSQAVVFTSTAPVDMLLTASPQSMPSLDVNPDMAAEVRAKVMDEKGNPVTGERVTFALSDIDTTGYNATAGPSLLTVTAVTDGDGYATVLFRPGAFITDRKALGYSPTATGTCTVTATWQGASRTVPLRWKNYPYLSVSASLNPETVEVNDTVNVTITLRGDGWALQPDPIDVVLAMDCSGSMRDAVLPSGTKMEAAKKAALTFVEQMDNTRDRIGIVPYYTTSAPVEVSLSQDYGEVKAVIESLSPGGWTPTRLALKNAIEDLALHPNSDPDAVRAVVLMSDGAYNYYGDPLARGKGSSVVYLKNESDPNRDYRTSGYCNGQSSSPAYDFTTLSSQNLSVHARSQNIRIYCISFGSGIEGGDNTYDTMTVLAESTGGFHEHAPDGKKLAEIYTKIAGDLKTEAGVNTTMGLVMKDLEVNNATVPNTVADPVLEYCFMQDASTLIESWTDTLTGRDEVVPLHTEDQTTDWEDDHNLHFAIGTVRLNQTWTATYTLKVLKDGNTNVFGPGSTLSFNGGADSLDLPKTFITAVPDLNNTGLNASALDVAALHRLGSGPVTDFLNVGWHLNYTGTGTSTQHLLYSTDDRKTWTWFATITPRPAGERDEEAYLDIRGRSTGKYWVRVHAKAPDAPDDIVELQNPITVGGADGKMIKLE